MENIIYRLADGRLWDVEKASWVASIRTLDEAASPTVIDLVSAAGVSDESYLIQTLEFYHFPLGILAAESPAAIKEELDRLDEKYLTPRTLAGLAIGDAYAQEQWREHETLAIPLRTRLAGLDNAVHMS